MTIKWTNSFDGLLGAIGGRTFFEIVPTLTSRPTSRVVSDATPSWRLTSHLPGDSRSPVPVAGPDEGKRLADQRLEKFLSDIGAMTEADLRERTAGDRRRIEELETQVRNFQEDRETLRRFLGIEALEDQIGEISRHMDP